MKILIPVLVGSIIGYFTNWLAIKMLFKPHYEKKIFGLTLPFTPGLIPKERDRMAANIGNTVGEHLLSTETIVEAISNRENEANIKKWLGDKLESLRKEERTIEEFIGEKILGDSLFPIQAIKDKLSKYLIHSLRDQNFKNKSKKTIERLIENYDTEELYKKIDRGSLAFLEDLAKSQDLKEEIESLILKTLEEASKNDKTLGELIDEDIYRSIDGYLDENKEKIGTGVRKILREDDVREKIQNKIADSIFDRSNKLILAFISPELISQKVFESLEKYIEKEETDEDIIGAIKLLLEKTKEKKLSDLALGFQKILDEESIEKISNGLVKLVLSEDNNERFKDKLIGLLRERENLGKDKLGAYIWDRLENLLDSPGLENKMVDLVDRSLDKILGIEISALVIKLNDDLIFNAYEIAKKIFKNFAREELPKIIELLNVSKIVEDKINSFDIDYAEKLILDIARKELNQITRLGALLGAVLGLLSPLLQYIY